MITTSVLGAPCELCDVRRRYASHFLSASGFSMRRHFRFKLLVRRPRQHPSSGTMAVALNTSLEFLWLSGREGRLSPFAQLKAVAYRDVMRELGVPEFGMLAKIATKLERGPRCSQKRSTRGFIIGYASLCERRVSSRDLNVMKALSLGRCHGRDEDGHDAIQRQNL